MTVSAKAVGVLLLSVVLVNCYCPNGWIRFDNSCYLFEDLQQLSWHAALNACTVHEANLVRVDSDLENNFIKAELVKLHPKTDDQFWTAGNDLAIENDWVWVHSKDRISQSYWHPGEPNQSGGDEDCLTYYTRYHLDWNDDHCDRTFSYICELDDSDKTDPVEIIG